MKRDRNMITFHVIYNLQSSFFYYLMFFLDVNYRLGGGKLTFNSNIVWGIYYYSQNNL